MNKIFVKTQNVRNFIGLVENLINEPKSIPKMGLCGLRVSMMGFI